METQNTETNPIKYRQIVNFLFVIVTVAVLVGVGSDLYEESTKAAITAQCEDEVAPSEVNCALYTTQD